MHFLQFFLENYPQKQEYLTISSLILAKLISSLDFLRLRSLICMEFCFWPSFHLTENFGFGSYYSNLPQTRKFDSCQNLTRNSEIFAPGWDISTIQRNSDLVLNVLWYKILFVIINCQNPFWQVSKHFDSCQWTVKYHNCYVYYWFVGKYGTVLCIFSARNFPGKRPEGHTSSC